MTKEQLTQRFEQWQKSRYDDLYKFYGRYSNDKMFAWNYCKDLYTQLNGYNDLRIVSGNTYHFTAGFQCDYKDYNFCFVTAWANYVCQVVCGQVVAYEKL